MSKKISEIVMVGPEEREIKVNEIFYKVKTENMPNYSRESWTGRGEVLIEPVRVITVNQTARHFRTRNLKGCETEYSLKDGCISGLYGSLLKAREVAGAIFSKDIEMHDKRLEKAKKIKASKAELVKKLKACKTLKPLKEPKRV